jgi:hypothetical protein
MDILTMIVFGFATLSTLMPFTKTKAYESIEDFIKLILNR